MRKNLLRTNWDKLNREEIRQLQGEQLHRYLKHHVYPFSKHYQAMFDQEGITPDDIHSLDDLAKIPFSSKLDLLEAVEKPEGTRDFVLIPDEKVLAKRPGVMLQALLKGRDAVKQGFQYEYRPVFLTSTTGRSTSPVPFMFTRFDIDQLSSAGGRLVGVLGASPEDRIINMFPFAPHLAFWQTHYATVTAGVFAIATGGGKVMGTSGNIAMIQKIKPSVLIGMPTFIYHVLCQAVEEGVKCDSLKSFVFGGEKVPAGMKKKLAGLAKELGSADVSCVATYGFTECRMAWGECPHPLDQEPSGYHMYPDLGLVEIIDPETGKVQPDGAPGEIVFTGLDMRGTVVLRYRTNDLISGGLVYGPCPRCGRRCPRLVGHISRRSEIKELQIGKIKGTLVDFNELEHVLDDFAEIGSWQVELRKIKDDPLELGEVILHIQQIGETPREELVQKLNQRFASVTELQPNEIFFHTPKDMRKIQGVGVELKEKRVADNRAEEGKVLPPRIKGESIKT